jgi:hypothetical protein
MRAWAEKKIITKEYCFRFFLNVEKMDVHIIYTNSQIAEDAWENPIRGPDPAYGPVLSFLVWHHAGGLVTT